MHPIDPAFFDDEDSEAEDAPEWLRQQYQRKVEEITDVNKVSPPLNCVRLVVVWLAPQTLSKSAAFGVRATTT